jgi:broad specificity phosphatase PhoE/FtsZ-binding cell division protein ZapB
MKQLVFIRHGDTELNDEHKIRAWTDVPLNVKGQEQAKKVGETLKHSSIDLIYSSDLDRAHSTADAINLATETPVVIDPDMRPWNLGVFTGHPQEEVAKLLPAFLDEPFKDIDGGESFNTFRNRFLGKIDQLMNTYPDKTLAIVAHHRNDRALRAWEAAGFPSDLSVDPKVFLDKGIVEPGDHYVMTIEKNKNFTEDHAEYKVESAELLAKKPQTTVAMGVGIAADRALTDLPPHNIKQDVRGELMMKRDEPIFNETDDEDDDELKDGDWVSAFRSGLHTDSDGVAHLWEVPDLQIIAQQYNKAVEPGNPERHVAPVVLGHPKDDSPAYGWISKAKAVGDKLYLKLSEMQPEFVDALKRGLYKTRSISLYPDLNIRHIGFLGGSVPAVKGLGPFKFAETKEYKTYEFEEKTMVDVNELKQENTFFKRLFSLFKIDVDKVRDFKEGTSSTIQTADQPVPYKTIDNKYPQGATMAESMIKPADHMKYAKSYLDKMKSHMDAAGANEGKPDIGTAVAGETGQDISSHKESATEFGRLAMHHMSQACEHMYAVLGGQATASSNAPMDHKESEVKPEEKKVEEKSAEKPADHAEPIPPSSKSIDALTHKELLHAASHYMGLAQGSGTDHCKMYEHLSKVFAHLEKAIVSGNFVETKQIPILDIKADKDKITELEKEISMLKEECKKLQLENEKLLAAQAQKQEQQAMGSYKEFCESLVAEGRLRPVDVEATVTNLKAREEMSKKETADFSEGKTTVQPTRDFVEEYKNYLSAMPKVVEMSELITGRAPVTQTPVDQAVDFVEAEIKKLQAAKPNLPYHEALQIVNEQAPDKVRSYVEAGFESK